MELEFLFFKWMKSIPLSTVSPASNLHMEKIIVSFISESLKKDHFSSELLLGGEYLPNSSTFGVLVIVVSLIYLTF